MPRADVQGGRLLDSLANPTIRSRESPAESCSYSRSWVIAGTHRSPASAPTVDETLRAVRVLPGWSQSMLSRTTPMQASETPRPRCPRDGGVARAGMGRARLEAAVEVDLRSREPSCSSQEGGLRRDAGRRSIRAGRDGQWGGAIHRRPAARSRGASTTAENQEISARPSSKKRRGRTLPSVDYSCSMSSCCRRHASKAPDLVLDQALRSTPLVIDGNPEDRLLYWTTVSPMLPRCRDVRDGASVDESGGAEDTSG